MSNQDLIKRIPPHNLEAEQATLGAMLHSKNAFEVVSNMLKPTDFFNERNEIIYDTMLKIKEDNKPIDPVVLSERLHAIQKLVVVGGDEYISSIMDVIPAVSNVEYYAKIVLEKSKYRQIINECRMTADYIYANQDKKMDEFITSKTDNITNLILGTEDMKVFDLQESVIQTLNKIQADKEAGKKIAGIKTGFKIYDEYTSGLKPETMNLIVAYTAVGKTSLAFQIAHNVALEHNVLYFNAEMSQEELNKRLLSRLAQLDNRKLKYYNYTEEEYNRMKKATQDISKMKGHLYIDSTPLIKYIDLKRRALWYKRKTNLDLIVIDHMLLIRGENKQTKHEWISDLANNIKGLAKELHLPILLLTQINREGAKAGEIELWYIKESGDVENACDTVLALNRTATDEMYYSIVKAVLLKSRDSDIGERNIKFNKQFTEFEDIENQGEIIKKEVKYYNELESEF